MRGYIDLHSHWLPDIDDGVTSVDEGIALLQGLASLGFGTVIATPHMRPGMFDNDRSAIEDAYARTKGALATVSALPETGLACEHFFDDIVFGCLMRGQGLPYPGGKCALLEFSADQLPTRLNDRLFDLRRKGIRAVIAHPERYAPVWRDLSAMEDLVDRGNALLLDLGSLAGKYGRAPRKAAERMLEEGLYYAACSDAHRPSDIQAVADGMARLQSLVGEEESRFLLVDGPRGILDGRVDL
jgi:protein-tyrosine phosphatase